uniref:Uncharacterized protein n=1 Tax=Aegilops tauschii subsp. strangulata TaxID=200361 RepID=A0A453N9V4_AEGTS
CATNCPLHVLPRHPPRARSRSRPPTPAASRPPFLNLTSSAIHRTPLHTRETAARHLQQPRPGSRPLRGVVSSFPVDICHRRRPGPAFHAAAVEDSDRVIRFVQRSSPPSPSATKLLGASVHLQI